MRPSVTVGGVLVGAAAVILLLQVIAGVGLHLPLFGPPRVPVVDPPVVLPLDDLANATRALEGTATELTSIASDLRGAIALLRGAGSALNGSAVALNTSLGTLQTVSVTLVAESVGLNASVTRLVQQVDRLEGNASDETEALRAQARNLTEALARVEGELAGLLAEASELQVRLNHSVAANAALATRAAELETNLTLRDQLIRDLTRDGAPSLPPTAPPPPGTTTPGADAALPLILAGVAALWAASRRRRPPLRRSGR